MDIKLKKRPEGGLRLKAWDKSIRKYWQLYVLLIPVLASYIIFQYVPMTGIQIAFKDFSLADGIWNSEWIGFYHFNRFLPVIKLNRF